jgi:two-component system, chemotaxis family, CheB/CheR fusion protein
MAEGKSASQRKSEGKAKQSVKAKSKSSSIKARPGVDLRAMDSTNHDTASTIATTHSNQLLVEKITPDGFGALVDILKQTKMEGGSTILLAQGLDPDLQRRLNLLLAKDSHVQITEAMHTLQREMVTVERDLKRLTTETAWRNNEVVNILQALQVPLLVLDKDLVVRRCSPAADELFGSSVFKVGQKVGVKTTVPVPDFAGAVSRVLSGEVADEMEFTDEHDRKWLMRSHPYVTVNGKTEGVILTFVNVDVDRRSEDLLRAHQAREQHVLDVVHSVLIVLDTYQNVRMLSRSGCALLGFDEAEIIGKNWVDEYIPRSHRIAAREIFDRIMSGELDDEYEYPVTTRGGEERVLSWRSAILRDEFGNVSGMICSGQDLTMLRQINNALENSEERFHVMMESVREDEFFIMDTEGYIISWIARREEGKSYRAEEMIGQHFSCLYSPDDFQSGKPMRILDVAEKEGRYEEDGWRLRKDGKSVRAYVIIIAIRDAENNLIGFSNVTRYMQDRQQPNEQSPVPTNAFFMDTR